jgi:hypothetical protein
MANAQVHLVIRVEYHPDLDDTNAPETRSVYRAFTTLPAAEACRDELMSAWYRRQGYAASEVFHVESHDLRDQ